MVQRPTSPRRHRHADPGDVHYGKADEVLARRQRSLDRAYAARPDRFPHGAPTTKSLPEAVYINPPEHPALGSESDTQ